MYPRCAPCWLFVDELIKATDLADEVEELAKLLNVVGADVSSLPLHVLAGITALNVFIEALGAEPRGDDDCLPEGFAHTVEIVHQSVEVFDLRLVGVVGDAFLECGGASCELREGKVLAHSLFAGYLLLVLVGVVSNLFYCLGDGTRQLLGLLDALLNAGGVMARHVLPYTPALGGDRPDAPKDGEVR